MNKKEIIAVLLAGGKGSRLEPLTRNTAKPALPFGAQYRIIDFTISNCTNSGIDTIGVLVQYKPFGLNSYLNKLILRNHDIVKGGLTILPPYSGNNGMSWYKGTANAVFHNIEYIEQYKPEYVIVLSGDHIYKMNYHSMLRFHKERNADVTIGVVPVPLKEASRFGILDTDKNSRIIEFQEKPEKPKSCLASMGIYIYKWDVLKRYLSDQDDLIDFGKNVIPAMLKNNETLYAYRFNGYWKDIGVIESYWGAHMDLLKRDGVQLLYDRSWPIYSAGLCNLPQYVSQKAVVKNSLIACGASIYGTVINSIIFENTYIGSGTVVKNSVILPEVRIGKNSRIEKGIIGNKTIIKDSVRIGYSQTEKKELNIAVIGSNCHIGEGTIINNGKVLQSEENYYPVENVYYA